MVLTRKGKQTMEYTFNTQNWEGETATIKVKDNKFTFQESQFELKHYTYEDSLEGFEILVDQEKLWNISRLKKYETNFSYEDEFGDFARSHSNPYILAAILAANLL
jgi:hypothetical protein